MLEGLMKKSNKQLTVFCKNCKYFRQQQLDKNSVLYSCKLTNESFSLDEPALNKSRKCYKEKLTR